MATAPITTHDLQIVPLASADLAALEALFDEQCEEWRELLAWDYTGPSRLIRDVARAGGLSGFVALYDGLPVGFTYYVFEESRCSMGEIFVSREWRGVGADRELAAAVLRKLDVTPRIRRVESQSLNVGNEEAERVFMANGFQRFDRCYMMIRRQDYIGTDLLLRQDTSPAWAIRPWRDEDFTSAVRVIHRSYENSVDCLINNQYSSEEGCADLVSILTEHIWCGSFLRHVSRVAVDRATGKLAGVLMASRVSPGVGHISQISVHPNFQGQGIGRQMIESALTEFFDLGFTDVSLAVTSANAAALHLYESCGFRTVHSFPVFFR